MSVTTSASRHEQKASTRAALLEAARRCLVERGSNGLGVADIARAAGVAYGTFYVHFATKDALLDELWTELDATLAEAVTPLLVRPSRESVRELAGVCLDHWLSHGALLRALVERAAARADLRMLRDGISPKVAALVEEAVGARLVAQGLLGMWTRIGLWYVFGGDERPTREQAIETLSSMTLGALGAA